MKYEQLEQEVAQQAKPVRDLSQAWERYQPLGEANEVVLGRIRHFAGEKRITLSALECMETRWAVRNGGAVWLAWAATAQLNGSRVVTAVADRVGEVGSWHTHPISDDGHPSDADLAHWLNSRDFLDRGFYIGLILTADPSDARWSRPTVHAWITRRDGTLNRPVCEPALVTTN